MESKENQAAAPATQAPAAMLFEVIGLKAQAIASWRGRQM
jgi:hypothetical protein